MTWPFIVLIFIIAAALIFAFGIKVGEEKMRDDQADHERDDEDHRQ